ncbi:unnamed protein product [Clonostachys chloroleuca]|uniref:Uncharacterized protein n=2 Tax=Clonostachys chloroleuca TaxID=1926264 RepID=A0AA35M2Z3_9HYPO|nr:unnamed protein product [Clonostachys chloroleuca]CAI6090990.1 unnamed protein product [Clonostachys chloroleuca]
MTPEEERQVTLRFTQAVHERLQSDLCLTGLEKAVKRPLEEPATTDLDIVIDASISNISECSIMDEKHSVGDNADARDTTKVVIDSPLLIQTSDRSTTSSHPSVEASVNTETLSIRLFRPIKEWLLAAAFGSMCSILDFPQNIAEICNKYLEPLTRPSVPEGYECERELYGDFPDTDQKALEELSVALLSFDGGSQTQPTSSQAQPSPPSAPIPAHVRNTLSQHPLPGNNNNNNNPQHQLAVNQSTARIPNQPSRRLFLELCINTAKRAKALER